MRFASSDGPEGEPVGIIDYGFGNLRSVRHALEAVGAAPQIIDDPRQVADHDRIVLPGVGAFGHGMRSLEESGMADAVLDRASQGVPLLGICLGMQLLADRGLEHGDHAGLGLIPGTVQPFRFNQDAQRIPHTGWNTIHATNPSSLLYGLRKDPCMYFTHSFVFKTDEAHTTSTCDYGGPFTATVENGNVAGVQFHPEKSQEQGLKLLANFMDWTP